jgi:hypothetical protein
MSPPSWRADGHGAGLLFLGAALWPLLVRHEGRRAARGLPRHGRGRLALAAAAMLAVQFTAASAFLVLASAAPIGAPAVLASDFRLSWPA